MPGDGVRQIERAGVQHEQREAVAQPAAGPPIAEWAAAVLAGLAAAFGIARPIS